MEKTHKHENRSTNSLPTKLIVESDLRAQDRVLYTPDFVFELGDNHEHLEEILQYIERIGLLANYKDLFGLLTCDINTMITHRIKWNGSTASLVWTFINLIDGHVLNRNELPFLSTKLPKIFSYLNAKGEYVHVQKSAVQSYKNVNRFSDEKIKGNKEVRSVNSIVINILKKIK